MRMSEGVEWSVHCLSVLAFIPPPRTLPAARLAELHGIPASYLAKHLQSLARAGLVEPISGPRGGFRLARPAERITLLDVVTAIDGPTPAFRCTEIRQRGPTALKPGCYRTRCGIAAAFDQADAAWRAVLQRTTLAQLVESLPGTVNPRQLEKGATWLKETLA